jgi:hypothetical protein
MTKEYILEHPDWTWRIYTPPKPDIVTYHAFYVNGALSGSYRDLEIAKEFKANNIELSAYIKTTIDGETGKIIVEMIVP